MKTAGIVTAYLASIVGVNVGFEHVPLVDVVGVMWPPMALAVGAIFVLRDYVQRAIGHWVLLPMATALAISWWMASPEIAIASATAFAISELADWSIYTMTRRPFRDRILLSSAVSTPLDSLVFLGMIGIATLPAVALMTASKMLAAVAIFAMVKR